MNISKIAKLAGVSNATVSRFLNNGYVSQDNRDKIQKIIDETGYIPSAHAKTLRTKKTNLIGIIVPKISSEAVSRMVEGISTTLSKEGYNILLGNTNLNIEKEIEYLNIFKNNQVDGIIFIATILTPKHLEVMERIKVPIILLGQESENYSSVYHDDYGAAKSLTKLFIEKGCCKIAFIGVTTQDEAAGAKRKKGYEDALKEAGRSIDESLIREGEFSSESGYESMSELVNAHPDVDGVFCATDNIAVGAITAIKEKYKDLHGIAIAGIGDSKVSKVITPQLTSMHYYYKTSGVTAGRMLLENLQEEKPIIRKVKLGFELQQRESLN
ncbi:MAG: LacI family DNA-binding transcriptional regulator [Clostridiales bacterium]|jgi:LacI family sucrose operon transcriptional repressor|nr:LacI family DNA-binding transcriptional regulator [Clostridiales bacterium]